MEMHGLIVWLIIGGVAGWLAGLVMKGGGYGIIGDIILGIVGSVIFGWIFGAYAGPAGGGLIGQIVASAIGAIILIFVSRLLRRVV